MSDRVGAYIRSIYLGREATPHTDEEGEGREIDQTKWRQKMISENIDSLILGVVNQAAGECAAQNLP
ncbi:unnamed protein product [Thelazia callipaeda]|uniref:Major capsid protein n=1 Tax=Thelazia callipaeda TaxID=103827 RepID=A0A0N5CUF2_THECL|nr:unnamed protein product [Thelazia callipaeda]